jgi:hypothetical protein
MLELMLDMTKNWFGRRRFNMGNGVVIVRHQDRDANVLPNPVMPSTPRCPRVNNATILPKPVTLSTPCRPRVCRYASFAPRGRDAVDYNVDVFILAMLMWKCAGSCSTWYYGQSAPWLLYLFLCHFWPTNPKFHILHYHIAFICYIVLICYTLLHCLSV